MNTYWHNLSLEKIYQILKTNSNGLSQKDIQKRFKKFGKNILKERKPLSKFAIFLGQFRSPLIYFLLFAGIITLILKQYNDAIVIFIAVIINALFGFWEENKTCNTLEKLKKILKTKATVLRDGFQKEIPQEEIVPGDIIILKRGNKIPADARIIQSYNLKVNEAILTGEWLPAKKDAKILPKEVPLANRDNMVYAGTLVEDGNGKAIVVATAKKTETGKISKILEETKEEATPLQKKIANFSKIIAKIFVVICLIIFIGGILRKGSILKMFETSVAIAVGGIPESLPITLTIILSIGMERILREKGLVRRLSSTETLGSTSVICSDKTRTLTQGKMTMSEIITSQDKIILAKKGNINDKKTYNLALQISSLCNEAYIENQNESLEKWIVHGSPTDRALLTGPLTVGVSKKDLENKMPQVGELSFDPTHKYQVSLQKIKHNEFLLCISGSPEKLLKLSKKVEVNGQQKKLEKKEIGKFKEKLNSLTSQGLRIIGLGYKKIILNKIPQGDELRNLCNNFIFVGLVALKDPLRPDAKDAIKTCKIAGMIPIIATGDHKKTAQAIAQELGLNVANNEILEGEELDKLSDENFQKIIKKIKIYARVEPKHKMRIISTWQKLGKVVAMTGDGVNDAPAIKKADIGLALGSGTDVAKEASDIILLNDSFSIIVKAIHQGRIISDNIKKAIAYILSDSFSSVILIGFGKIIFGWPLPILPTQILWNNIVEDSLPSIAYAFEPGEKNIMKRKPIPLNKSLFTREMKIMIFATGLIDEFIILALFWFLWKYLGHNLAYTRTMIFGATSLDTAFVIFCYKNLRKNIWHFKHLFSNKLLNISSITTFIFFAASIYLPPIQKIIHTVPLNLKDWLLLITLGLLSMMIIELTKWWFISRHETEE